MWLWLFVLSYHEPVEGEFDWGDRGNLTLFLDAIADAGLFANLRIGPYGTQNSSSTRCDYRVLYQSCPPHAVPVWLLRLVCSVC